jgi:L-2-hydroxyglutarate oxidase LhgO
MSWDVAIVGAGVIGLACAERLTRAGMQAVVLERHGKAGQETSSRNSQVLHAGMYYTPGTLKASLCVRGNASLGAWCVSHDVPHARMGKLIVATDASGTEELSKILERGRANGVASLDWATRDQISAEPNVIAHAALWSPNTGIIDAHPLMDSFAASARSRGCDFAFKHSLLAVDRTGDGWSLHVRDASGESSSIDVRRVVNAAGLWADDVAALTGLDVDALGYRQHFVKGNYFRVRKRIASRLVYPVPPRNLVGLGVHVTVELDGAVRLGPDVEPLADRTPDYRVDENRRKAFFDSVSTYMHGFTEDDLSPDQSGIRPKLSKPGAPPRDFVISQDLPGWVNLLGIESPGMTCALEIADRVTSLLA